MGVAFFEFLRSWSCCCLMSVSLDSPLSSIWFNCRSMIGFRLVFTLTAVSILDPFPLAGVGLTTSTCCCFKLGFVNFFEL